MSVEQLERALPDILANCSCVDLVYLFGSQATGSVGPMSDYDIGVLVGHRETVLSLDRDQIRIELAHDLAVALCTDRIDVIILNDAPIELQYAVIAQGKRLYQRDTVTRVEYEAYVMGAYGDYLPILRAQRQDILRGGDRGTRVQRYRTALGRTRRTLDKITSTQ